MAQRYPYDSAGQPNQDTLNAIEEAMFIQRQQQDLRLRMLLRERLDPQNLLSAAPTPLRASSLYDQLQYTPNLAQRYEQELLLQQQQQQQQEQIHRQQQIQQQLQSNLGLTGTKLSHATSSAAELEAAAKLQQAAAAATTLRRTASYSLQRKRSFESAQASDNNVAGSPSKRRANSIEDEKAKAKSSPNKTPKQSPPPSAATAEKAVLPGGIARKKQESAAATAAAAKAMETELQAREALQALATVVKQSETPKIVIKGTLDELLRAADSEQRMEDAIATMAGLKKSVIWEESDDEDDHELFEIGDFTSKIPKLIKEPSYKGWNENQKQAAAERGATKKASETRNETKPETKTTTAFKSPSTAEKVSLPAMKVDYPYPVDPWWPSASAIRKERRAKGEPSDDEDFADTPSLYNEDNQFTVDIQAVQHRLANEQEPGVLEKIPHCRIHRLAMQQQKSASIPDHAFCWQVTENYCNEPMVCCSVCGTWRHAACGGHYKPVTVRDTIETPFVAICDRCHAERSILREFPRAAQRLERQRVEQIRRGLATSAVIRQAAFAKHGGTYKWPLGSVSTTHIGGHTRSVHSRHDKADKQWAEMVARLSGQSVKSKDKMKARSREFERLLVSIEDAEGVTDRHNMTLFLKEDTSRQHPVGYEKRRRNIFNPADDETGNVEVPLMRGAVLESEVSFGRRVGSKRTPPVTQPAVANNQVCARLGCTRTPRFDSIFCCDSCGVSALQLDLLRSLQYAGDIHPSLLRSYP